MKQSLANELTQLILADLFRRGIFAWRQNTVGIPVRRGGVVVGSRPAGKSGVPDICAIRPPTGQFLGIEVKAGKDRMREEQIGFCKSSQHVGAIYMVVHTWEDYIHQLSTFI